MDNLLQLTDAAPLSLTGLVVNLLLGILLASVLAWFYARYGQALSNRGRFAQTLPILAIATVLIISVIKSSLALSLGLVGALSIVRFRTAIKEPEELLYLFMVIAIGVGLGADQRAAAIVATAVFLGYLLARRLTKPRRLTSNLYLNVSAPSTDSTFAQIRDVLLKHVPVADLRRLDSTDTKLQATCLIECPSDGTLVNLMDDLRTQVPGCECSFVEQDNTLGA
jgi:hypothetical protein